MTHSPLLFIGKTEFMLEKTRLVCKMIVNLGLAPSCHCTNKETSKLVPRLLRLANILNSKGVEITYIVSWISLVSYLVQISYQNFTFDIRTLDVSRIKCAQKCRSISGSFGRWKNTWLPYLPGKVLLKLYFILRPLPPSVHFHVEINTLASTITLSKVNYPT